MNLETFPCSGLFGLYGLEGQVKPKVSPTLLTLVDYKMGEKSKAVHPSKGLFSPDSLGPSGLFQ